MFCTKCGANNGDNNVFCKNCGAKLVKPLTNNQGVSDHSVLVSQSTPNNSGVARTAKSVNVKLIAGLAVAMIVVVMVVGVLIRIGSNSNKPLFEQIKIGKTTAAEVEKYFDKNNLGYDWDITGSQYDEYRINDTFWGMGHNFGLVLSYDKYNEDIYGGDSSSFKEYVNTNTLCNDLSDTLWGADCEYIISVSGDSDDKDKKRKVLYTSCIVTIDGKDEEREFSQNLNKYLKKHQKTKFENKSYREELSSFGYLSNVTLDATLDATYYPLEVISWEGEKALTFLCYNDALLESDGIVLLTFCAERYYSDEEMNTLMKEKIFRNDNEEAIIGDNGGLRTVHTGIYIKIWDSEEEYNIGIYFKLLLNDMYLDFEEKEFEAIRKEMPDLVCDFDIFYKGSDDFSEEGKSVKGIEIMSCDESAAGDLVIPETIHGYSVMRIDSSAFSGCSSLKSIKIPNNIKGGIWENTFSGCSSLTSINIPDGNGYIGRGAFSGCSSLTSVTLPNDIAIIDNKAFANCSNLISINIPDSVIKIADDAFDGCDKLVSDELMSRFPSAVPKPSWLEAYREYINNVVCIVGTDNVGIPYLAVNYDGLYHYNGNEVEKCIYLHDAYYNPQNNKLLIYESGKSYSLIDLYTCNTELDCSSYYDYESGSISYRGNNGIEISRDEYTRIYNEIMNQMGKKSEDECYMQFYDSIDEAYQAYISNEPNTSASSETPAADVQIPAPAETTPAEPVSEYILEDSNSRYLTKSDLQGLSADECRIARNEIYARYGRKFNDEELQSYFNSCSWYHGTIEPDDFQESMLNDYEIENKNLIVEYEKEMGYR